MDIYDHQLGGYLGTIVDVCQGSISSQRYNGNEARQESADGRGTIGIRKDAKLTDGTPAPKVRYGDRLVIGSVRYEVVSDSNWDSPHALTGRVFPRVWYDVTYRR
ncbi:hypothetical protein [Mycobacterium arosiense]|uniref:hypothetical protein n=1 Tax=Mycobacterium arosiense TaxID=425468 RepID=UPI001153D246|nr:hypothetical protein [Mycobacterium arosiense]